MVRLSLLATFVHTFSEVALVCEIWGDFEEIWRGPLNSEKHLVHSITKISSWTFHLRGIFFENGEDSPHHCLVLSVIFIYTSHQRQHCQHNHNANTETFSSVCSITTSPILRMLQLFNDYDINLPNMYKFA